MNIYDFIESKDVRIYLQQIEHNFTAFQCVYLIKNSKRPLEEKHKAYDFILKYMPDEYVNEKIPSLHKALEKYITVELGMAEHLTSGNGRYYTAPYNEGLLQIDNKGICFDSIQECLDSVMPKDNENSDSVYVIKEFDFQDTCKKVGGTINSQWQVMKLYFEDKEFLTQEGIDALHIFDGLGIMIPTPFKKGDILEGDEGKPFVLAKEFTENAGAVDEKEMKPFGYECIFDTVVQQICVDSYLECVYSPNPTNAEESVFSATSKLLSGKYNLDEFLCMYEVIKARHSLLIAERRAANLLG